MLKFVIIVSCTAAIVLGASIDDGGPRHPHSIGHDTPVTSKRQNPAICEGCKLVIQWIEQQLPANATEKEIDQLLENDVCDKLPFPQFKDACKQFVEADLSTIIKALVNKDDPATVCAQVKACSQKVTSKRQEPIICAGCKLVIGWIESQLTANATEKEIEQFLENDVCDKLPFPELKDPCKQFVEGDLSTLIKALVNKEDPATVCTQVKACSQKVTRKIRASLPCELCELLIQGIENGLAKNATEQQIEKDLEDVCSLLPGSLADTCKSLVQQYTPQLIQMLINKEDPETVCKQVGLCQALRKRQQTLPCDICELVFKELEKVISENSTESDVEQALEKVCDILSPGTAQECKQVIDNFAPEIISEIVSAILSSENPKTVCTQLDICQQKVIRKRQSTLCTPCELLLGILEVQLEKNTTEKDIEQLVENICNILPDSFAEACKQVVEQDLPSLIQMLVNKEEPSKICTQLGLCKGKVATKRQAKPFCAICQLVIKELESIIQKNSTEEEIIKALEEVCTIFSASIKDQCDSFIQIYAPEIIQLLISRADPKDICTTLTLCSSKDRYVQHGR